MLTYSNVLAAYLYLHLAEPEPEPPDFNLDDPDEYQRYLAWCRENEDWYLGRDDLEIDLNDVESFLTATESLLWLILDYRPDPDNPLGPQYMKFFYDAAKEAFGEDKAEIRRYFRWLYLVVFERPDGPRWGEFISYYGVTEFYELVLHRFRNLIICS